MISSQYEHSMELAYRSIQFILYVSVFIIIIVNIWDVDVSNVIFGAGALGIIVGFAARKLLGSLLSGFIILSTKPYKINDWIEFNGSFGRIEKISFQNTQIRTTSGEKHIIPNDHITSSEVTNISDGRYRNDLLIGINYETDIDKAIDICNSAVKKLEEDEATHIETFDPTTIKSFDDSQITLSVKVWLKNPTPRIINHSQTKVFKTIKKEFDEEDISIPYPHRTINYSENGS